jgi:hypothetical protein
LPSTKYFLLIELIIYRQLRIPRKMIYITIRMIKPITIGPAMAIQLELLDGSGSSGNTNGVSVGVAATGGCVLVGWSSPVIVGVICG